MRGSSNRAESTAIDILLGDVSQLCASKTQPLSTLDRAHQIERVLSALGWNIADPTEVTRHGVEDGSAVSLELNVTGVQSLLVTVCNTMNDRSDPPQQSAGWAVVTDGVLWQVWPSEREGSSKGILTTSKNAGEELDRYLSKRAHAFEMVDRLEISRRISALVEAEVDRILTGSSSLVDQTIGNLPDIVAAKAAEVGFLDVHPAAGGPTPSWTATTLASAPWRSANCPGADIVWPYGATHILRRKGCASFIRWSRDRRAVELLPGSVMRSATRASFPSHHRQLREEALLRGYIVPDSDLLRVVTVLLLDTPSTAATLVSGTVENGWTAWRDREGKPIPRVAMHRTG